MSDRRGNLRHITGPWWFDGWQWFLDYGLGLVPVGRTSVPSGVRQLADNL